MNRHLPGRLKNAAKAKGFRTAGQPHASRAFTLVELLVVISIIGILAGLVVGMAPAATAKMRESRLRTELNQLTLQIEEYKSRKGFYPPDGLDPITGLVRPEKNPLFYELTGCLVTDANDEARGRFQSMGNEDGKISSAVLKSEFGRDGIANSSTEIKGVYTASIRSSLHKELYKTGGSNPDIEILVTMVPWPLRYLSATDPYYRPPLHSGNTTAPLQSPNANPWRYVSSTPTNNPGSFDLWVEYFDGREPDPLNPGQTRPRKAVIGNWRN